MRLAPTAVKCASLCLMGPTAADWCRRSRRKARGRWQRPRGARPARGLIYSSAAADCLVTKARKPSERGNPAPGRAFGHRARRIHAGWKPSVAPWPTGPDPLLRGRRPASARPAVVAGAAPLGQLLGTPGRARGADRATPAHPCELAADPGARRSAPFGRGSRSGPPGSFRPFPRFPSLAGRAFRGDWPCATSGCGRGPRALLPRSAETRGRLAPVRKRSSARRTITNKQRRIAPVAPRIAASAGFRSELRATDSRQSAHSSRIFAFLFFAETALPCNRTCPEYFFASPGY